MNARKKEVVAKALDDATRQAFEEEKRNIASQKRAAQTTSINKLSTGSDGIFNRAYDDENVGVVADFNNMDNIINFSHIPTLRIHKNHPKDQILEDPKSAVQTRGKIQKASSAQQALETAILSTTEEGLQAISATIDGHEKLITEDSLRRHLKLDDAEGISSLSNEEIFEQLAHMGSKKTAWDQFSSNIATALICLATSRRFNFSKFIFEASLRIGYPPNTYCIPTRFIELLLNKQQRPLRCIMEETASMPHDSPLHDVHSHGSAEGSVQQHSKETEYKLKSSNPRSKGKDFLSDDEEIAKDSSKQGGRFLKIYLGRWGKKKESEFNAEHKQELYKKKEEEKKKD
ncbi:hypothetical protein Tco_1538405 [Tanacetum coccineum]